MSKVETDEIPDEFPKIMKDFTCDMINTFPEYEDDLKPYLVGIVEEDDNKVSELFEHCKKVYPSRFFDLLYQNEDVFKNDEYDLTFLPNVNFKDVWANDISEKTRLIIWKYLQLVCFSVVNTQKDTSSFGDAASLFEAINEDELKRKLEETMEQMSGIFDMSGAQFEPGDMPDMPNPDDLHEHISGILDGKLGRLATEITEETLKDFTDISGANSVGDVFKALFKNPGRLMNMIKKVGGNLDAKIKSGEIKESELMEEASQLMQKLNNVPGMKNMQKMFGEMGLPMNGKLNMNDMQAQMKNNIGKAKTKERLRRKLEARRQAKLDNKDEQIRILQQQLQAARMQNQNIEQFANLGENQVIKKSNKNKKKKRKRKKK